MEATQPCTGYHSLDITAKHWPQACLTSSMAESLAESSSISDASLPDTPAY